VQFLFLDIIFKMSKGKHVFRDYDQGRLTFF